jgi:hypothetical protein
LVPAQRDAILKRKRNARVLEVSKRSQDDNAKMTRVSKQASKQAFGANKRVSPHRPKVDSLTKSRRRASRNAPANAAARERSDIVRARRLRVAIVDTSSALVEVCARCAVADVSRVARARERPRDV